MKFIRVLKATNEWFVDKISETDWVIKSPDGTYKNSDGKDYHFKTKEDALEELDYLRAEHKFDKKADYSSYTEEDKAIYNETMDLLKECRDLLDWHYEQGKDMNFDDYELDDTQRLYRKADLEVLKNIKAKIETLFEN